MQPYVLTPSAEDYLKEIARYSLKLKESGLALSQFCMNVWIGLPDLKTVWIDTTNGLYSVS
jgi:hypothetical protein